MHSVRVCIESMHCTHTIVCLLGFKLGWLQFDHNEMPFFISFTTRVFARSSCNYRLRLCSVSVMWYPSGSSLYIRLLCIPIKKKHRKTSHYSLVFSFSHCLCHCIDFLFAHYLKNCCHCMLSLSPHSRSNSFVCVKFLLIFILFC